jgi:hypothetical protein
MDLVDLQRPHTRRAAWLSVAGFHHPFPGPERLGLVLLVLLVLRVLLVLLAGLACGVGHAHVDGVVQVEPLAVPGWDDRVGGDVGVVAVPDRAAGVRQGGAGDGAGQSGSAPGTADALNLDVPTRPLAEGLEAFWSPGLSPARLRALADGPPSAAPDLLLRMFPPPPV